jgi:hypothetical protein
LKAKNHECPLFCPLNVPFSALLSGGKVPGNTPLNHYSQKGNNSQGIATAFWYVSKQIEAIINE